jgi:hypothetical protein
MRGRTLALPILHSHKTTSPSADMSWISLPGRLSVLFIDGLNVWGRSTPVLFVEAWFYITNIERFVDARKWDARSYNNQLLILVSLKDTLALADLNIGLSYWLPVRIEGLLKVKVWRKSAVFTARIPTTLGCHASKQTHLQAKVAWIAEVNFLSWNQWECDLPSV